MRTVTVWLLAGMLLSSAGAGCKKREDVEATKGKPEKALVDRYQLADGSYVPYPSIHLSADTVYTLAQSISRNQDEQLIIDPGTLIRVSAGGALVSVNINPGGTIVAEGTVEKPIIFTSDAAPGTQGDNWGGIVITGKSIINDGPGGDPNDMSGALSYLRIEFGRLVLTGVGLRTTLHHLEVSYCSQNAAFEINGGACNADHLISYAANGAADFYFSRGYSGKLQFLLACRHPFFGVGMGTPSGSLAGVYVENTIADPSGQAVPVTSPVISNLTVLGPEGLAGIADRYTDDSLRTAALITTRHSGFWIRNSVLAGFPRAAWYIDDAATAEAYLDGNAELSWSFFETADSSRTFLLEPGSFNPYTSNDFRQVVLNPARHNRVLTDRNALGLVSATDFNRLDFTLTGTSPLEQGAAFSGDIFSDDFFQRVAFIGAMGTEDWSAHWANFIPLKTNYNFPQ